MPIPDPFMSDLQRSQDRVSKALLDIRNYAIGALRPYDGTVRMHPDTYREIVINAPPELAQPFFFGSSTTLSGIAMLGCPVELDDTIPVNEVRYRVEQSVVVALVPQQEAEGDTGN